MPEPRYAEFAGASDDGSRVFIRTGEALVAGDTDDSADLYVWSAGVLVHVSDNPVGPDGDQRASGCAVSPDGSSVVFSTTERLAASDTDDEVDVYRRTAAGALIAVSDRDAYVSTLVPDPPPAPPGPATPRDTTAPRVTGIKVVRRQLRFRLSEPSRSVRTARPRRSTTCTRLGSDSRKRSCRRTTLMPVDPRRRRVARHERLACREDHAVTVVGCPHEETRRSRRRRPRDRR